MARIEHIKRRLENWGMWAARQEGGGAGYATRNILAVDVWARGTYGGAVIPVFDEEAMETDKAVTSMKAGHHHLVDTVVGFHVENLGVSELAYRLGCAPSTVHSRLAQADKLIAEWLSDRANERERARIKATASFPT